MSYSRQIRAIGHTKIAKFYRRADNGQLPAIDHQAIEHLFIS